LLRGVSDVTTVIVDYGSGNLRSAAKAFERGARECGQGEPVVVSSRPEDVAEADHIVLPGVGAFGDCHSGLRAVDGMTAALEEAVLQRGRPFLGICVGMQLLATTGREHGDHAGFGWIPGEVSRITPDDPSLKIPHMGWNELAIRDSDHPVLFGLPSNGHAYFVHSYAFRTDEAKHVLATVGYGGTITAVIGRDNLVGTQFHPEKSQSVGLSLIRNFLGWLP
jgi:glutamine amidotransferase